MTKLLLNTATVPVYTDAGAPVAPGGIVLSDEMEHHQLLEDDGVLVYVKPSELPEDLEHLTDAAREHVSGNAESGSGDDASVSNRTRRAAQS